LAVVAAAVLLVVTPQSGGAQSAPMITAGRVDNNFPDGMVFHASAEAAETITDVRLRYEVLPDGTSANAKPEFTPGTNVKVQVTLDAYLPPGTIINYHWEVRAGGEASKSPDQSIFYDDIRFEWEKLEAGNLSVYHYTADDSAAQALHDVGVQALTDAEALLDTDVPFPVNVWIYDSREDMQPALQRTSPTYESGVVTLGVRVTSDTVLVLGEVSYDTLRHELTHVVTAVAGDSAFGSLPFWIDEGAAVYFQQDKSDYQDAIEEGIESGDVLSVHEITTSPGVRGNVSLFYGESWSIVSFLIDTYGQEKFARVFVEVKSGELLDDALETVYGFDQEGLENAWREANGLPPRVTPEPTEAPQRTGAPLVRSTDDGGTSTSTLIAIAVGVLALAAVVGVGGIALARRLS
jgi:hypothetical protein